MASDNNSSKTMPRKPGSRTSPPQLPQINPPLLNGGPESVRDSNC